MFLVIIDDDEDYVRLVQDRLAPLLEGNRLTPRTFHSPGEALVFIKANLDRVALIMTDYRMPEMDGLEVIDHLQRGERDYQIILCCASLDQKLIRSLPHLNIFDVFQKDDDIDVLLGIIAKAAFFYQEQRKQKTRMAELLDRFQSEDEAEVENLVFHGIVGKSPAVLELIEKIQQAADSGATCLIHGESGTGKELVARNLAPAESDAHQRRPSSP